MTNTYVKFIKDIDEMNDINRENYLNSKTKEKLIKKIKTYNKKNQIKVFGLIKKSKQELINYIIKNIPEKRVRFDNVVEFKPIGGRTDKERDERKKDFLKWKLIRKSHKNFQKIHYRELPTEEEYIKIKKNNENKDNLKKKVPMNFIKDLTVEEKKRTLYKREKYINHKIKYKITKHTKYITVKTYEKYKGIKISSTKKKFYYSQEENMEYKIEYEIKKYLHNLLKDKVRYQ